MLLMCLLSADDLMVEICEAYMKGMGILVFNRIDDNGKLISDKNWYVKNEKVCKEIKTQYGLTFSQGKQNVNLDRLRPDDRRRYEMYFDVKKALDAKLTAVDQKMSEFVKPEDFEQKIKKRDKVKNDPVCLAQEDRDMLDSLKSQLDKRNQRFSVFSQIISGNKIWFLYLILTAVLSIGITILIMKNSVNEWAHRAMIAAIDMNEENPIGIYLTCRAEMPHNQYESRKTDLLEYAVICRLTGVEDVQVYNIRVKVTLTIVGLKLYL